MTDSTKMTKRRDLDSTSGLMVESTKVGGIWVNSMVWGLTQMQVSSLNSGFGKMGNE